MSFQILNFIVPFILEITRSGVHVLFIDYGNDEVVNPNDVKELASDIASLPAQALCCAIEVL